jgi:hypothetical protein
MALKPSAMSVAVYPTTQHNISGFATALILCFQVERIQSEIEVINTTVDDIKRLSSIMLLLPGGSGRK